MIKFFLFFIVLHRIYSLEKCDIDMIQFKSFCMDIFEAPNIPNHEPLYFQTAIDGENWCKEKNKRLCTENEWIDTCSAESENRTYPYGNTYVINNCNDNKTWKGKKKTLKIAPNWEILAKYPRPESFIEAKRLYQVCSFK
jgi:hypothetical protein